MANTLDQSQGTDTDGYEATFGTTTRMAAGQFFKAGVTGPFSRASFSLAKNGSPTDNLVVKLYSASINGTTLSVGSLLATSTTNYTGSSLPTYPAPFNITNAPFVDFDFNGLVSQTANSYYFIACFRTGTQDNTNYYVEGGASTNLYANGSQLYSDGSGNWGTGDTANSDQAFRTYYDLSLTTTTSTSSSTSSTSSSISTSSTSSSTSTSSTSTSISTSSTSSSISSSTSISTSSTSSSTSTSSTSSSTSFSTSSTSSSTSTSISTSSTSSSTSISFSTSSTSSSTSFSISTSSTSSSTSTSTSVSSSTSTTTTILERGEFPQATIYPQTPFGWINVRR